MKIHPTMKRLARLIEPRPRLTISEWAELKGHLPPEGNAEPGKYRGSRMPWQAAMLDDSIDPEVNEAGWMIAKRMGKSVCINLSVEYFIEHIPSSILVKYPTLDAGKKWIRGQLMKMVKATPCMQGLLKEPRERDSNSSMMDRHFPGGDLTVVGANSPAGLRQLTKRVVYQEEIDADEVSAEGDAVALADGRSETFHNAVRIKTSTPGLKGFSRIEEIFDRSDKQYYHVPCPCCGHFQHLQWKQVKWTFSLPEYELVKKLGIRSPEGSIWVQHRDGEIMDSAAAVYVCEKCGGFWNDSMRITAILSGHRDNEDVSGLRAAWRATSPFKGIRGRHLNGLYRIIGRKKTSKSYLHEFVTDFLTAKSGGRETLRVWVNNFLAETFSDTTKEIPWHPIMSRAEEYGPELPEEVALVLASADVHDDRIEILVGGFGDEEELWGIQKMVVYGNFDLPECQARVDDALATKWVHPSGVEIGITSAAIDAGHKTKAVYRFCARRFSRRIWPVLGSRSENAPLVGESRTKRKVFHVGTDTAKDQLFSRLMQTEPGPRYIHFPKNVVKYTATAGTTKEYRSGFDEAFYRQFGAEKLEETFFKGVLRRRYVRHKARNEAIDLFVYLTAAYDILKPNVPRVRENIIPKTKVVVNPGAAPKEYVLKQPGGNEEETKVETAGVTKPAGQQRPKRYFPPQRVERPHRPQGRPGGGIWNPLGL